MRVSLGSSANMVRYLIPLSLCLIAPAIADAQGADSLSLRCEPTLGSSECIYDTSITQLLARPEVYDGKRVRLKGYIHFQFEGNGIYPRREDEHGHLYRNGLWVQVKDGVSLPLECQDRYVLVEGTFVARHHGHYGLLRGAVTDITRCVSSG